MRQLLLLLTSGTILSAAVAPLYFEKNLGQADARVHYLARTRQATVFVTGDETVFSLRGPGKLEAAIHMNLVGSSTGSSWTAEEKQSLTITSYVGLPDRWRESLRRIFRGHYQAGWRRVPA